MPIHLLSPLPYETCVQRLREHMFLDVTDWQIRQRRYFEGDVTPPRFFVYRRHRYRSNIFGPIFYGKLSPHEMGTAITGMFRMHTVVLLLLTAISGLVVYQAILDQQLSGALLLGVPIGIPLIAYIIDSRNNEQVLNFLRQTLDTGGTLSAEE